MKMVGRCEYDLFALFCLSSLLSYHFNWNWHFSDARFFIFQSTHSDSRRKCANFWQMWFNQTFTSSDYNSFFYNEPPDGDVSAVTPSHSNGASHGSSKRTTRQVNVDQSAATPVYVQSPDGKNSRGLHPNTEHTSAEHTVRSILVATNSKSLSFL